MIPFPFIEELKNLEYLTGFNDVLKILGMVYSTIPWHPKPYTKDILYGDIESLYRQFKEFKLGGWCGLNAEYFKWIMEGYRKNDFTIKYRSYNFGLSYSMPPVEYGPAYNSFTHIGVTVEIDRMEFFFDPYFGRYFVHIDGHPLQIKDLLFLISERKFNKYRSVFLPLKKPALREDGTVEYLTPQQLMAEIFDFFNKQGLPKLLMDTFGTKNPDSLMLIKIPD